MFEGIAVHLWLCWGAVYLLALASGAQRPCPPSCRCSAAPPQVNCSGGQHGAVPAGLPRDAELLDLTHNQIKTLASQQFSALARLLHLDLSDNLLALLEADAFLGLRRLLTLQLARNHLKIIPAGVFAGLINLQLLDVSDNEILVFLDFTFRDLAALRSIRAAGNDLVFVSGQAFAGLTSARELHLDGGNLTSVPTDALAQLRVLRSLHYRHVGLATLPNYAFRQLAQLKELVLSHGPRLEALSGNSLFGLNLTSLAIVHCGLSAVPYLPLHHLVYLLHLDLSFNPITYVHRNMLGDLLRLREFHLVGGSLLHIEVGAFRGLAHLALLNVSKNLLSTLEADVFHSLDTLRSLGLDQNPLACDCRLLWVVRRRPYLDLGGHAPTCSTSMQLQSWDFLDFSQAELPGLLVCRRPRILDKKPEVVKVDQGHTVVLYCGAEGDPAPSITWLNPQLTPLSPTGRIRALSNGSLEVRYAQPQDGGAYLCVASNAAGNDSQAVGLHVRVFPSPAKNVFHLKGWFAFPSASPGAKGNQTLPFDAKTLLVAVTIGFLSFFSSVSVCFVFMFFWSKSKGQIKHTATIAYVPRSAVSNNTGGRGNYMETSRFTMKLI
ncbi:leucine-rich repeat and immunoglobulin-like domain-containing nogo receptor-interacting protein 1 [Betta splendens]|uniref:leucine-rich repeat and immunoglobulin-like domain-containing nogo receptor-interacting protein 1 n=1 Tax=Betta splendens TaxID=158456 RepID=UPI0010F73F1B|nr:leucine-rich repeat and immunoglobulin-like domain-containing nogo receptor-interacting protein 1 [Betta splendens]